MLQFRYISLILVLFLFTGCADAYVNDGVLRNESGDSILEDGNVPVVLQDQTTDPLEFYMMQMINNVTIAINTNIDDRNITLIAGHGFLVGEWLCLQETNKLYQGQVLAVVGDVITVDTPLDFNFSVNAFGCRSIINMAVDGSATPQIFRVKPIPGEWDVEWDITRIICSITDGSAMDTSKFGGLPALTNGVVLRKKDGVFKNLYNVKTNGQYADIAYDVSFDDRAPAGFFGFRVRKTWAGQAKSGVAIRLDSLKDEELQNLIQDDLTGLNTYFCRVMGSLTN